MSMPEISDKDWELICRIIAAFRGVTLQDGVGLKQAVGMDNHESPVRLAKLRSKDEKENWERISTDTLKECSSALSFFDAKGTRFHLPAYLIACLSYELEVDLMFHLTHVHDGSLNRFSLLNAEQRAVVRDFLEVCLTEADEVFGPDIRMALSRYWNSPVHIGCDT